jgi:hypothetical protein
MRSCHKDRALGGVWGAGHAKTPVLLQRDVVVDVAVAVRKPRLRRGIAPAMVRGVHEDEMAASCKGKRGGREGGRVVARAIAAGGCTRSNFQFRSMRDMHGTHHAPSTINLYLYVRPEQSNNQTSTTPSC